MDPEINGYNIHNQKRILLPIKEIDSVLKELVDRNYTPSVQYLLYDKERLIYKFQYGLADIINKIKVSDHTTYNAYSVTKTFTALAVLQLADQKLLDIEDHISIYLPEFPYGPDITIRQILTHSSGIPNPQKPSAGSPGDTGRDFLHTARPTHRRLWSGPSISPR